MKNKVDLHIHTTSSDGTKTPNEVLKEAEELGLTTIAITDHESVGAYENLNKELFSGTILTGIELKTYCKGREIELLGYGISLEKMHEDLPKIYKSKDKINKDYLKAIIDKLKSCNIKLPEDVEEKYKDPTLQPAKYISKVMTEDKENINQNMENLFKDKTQHERTESLYRGWLSNPKSDFYVKFQGYPDYTETIKLIKKCNGKVFIPHIFQYKEMSEEILYELLLSGQIDGIECYYPTFTQEQTEKLLQVCTSRNLFVSGGSDYHGANKKNELGRGLNNNLYVPEEKVKLWTNILLKKLEKDDQTEEKVLKDMYR